MLGVSFLLFPLTFSKLHTADPRSRAKYERNCRRWYHNRHRSRSRHLFRRREERHCRLQPYDLLRGFQAAVDRVIQFLSSETKTITTTAEISQFRYHLHQRRYPYRNSIAQATEKVRKEDVITVKQGRTIADASKSRKACVSTAGISTQGTSTICTMPLRSL